MMSTVIEQPLGDYCSEVHLFPFRTEKLSSLAQMVLVIPGEYVVANFLKPQHQKCWGFFVRGSFLFKTH